MQRFTHPASDPAANGPQQPAATDRRDPDIPVHHSPTGDTRIVRSQLLKMIVENERRRTEATTPTSQR